MKNSWYNESLHIFAQQIWHDEAAIVGTKDSLIKLRNAINNALDEGYAETECMVTDGEGYNVCIKLLDQHDSQWGQLMLPYTDEIASLPNQHKSVKTWHVLSDTKHEVT